MVKLSAILIGLLGNFAGNSIATELDQVPNDNNNDVKLARRTIIPLTHGAGNTQPSIPPQSLSLQPINPQQAISAAGKPGAPPLANGFQSHFGQAKSIQPNGFKMPMVVHQGFRPVMKAEASRWGW
ncbi:hypothetical protein CONCODRAFT_166086 [Conidiobolus coronatus NRRL 28638]|uniref:Uncharacterized protein n=1 Tax=Conidiobolus coronatus (strain ATCC 28846 / CBS 209.66 / NRRL 28638) TaxID=796925 RepID=A0A137P1H9_CONC2|nr:hypothetical protein CONCODRAFT_166086 [Conidiobolus coronatus NRRL 28638]|eukprot:KXN68916.1 hypothetical protein CONCODRAFT_166086 [Conidiobolus coronatus NRRL 28638]